MKTFLFAYLDFFDNDNKIIEVKANDALDATRTLAMICKLEIPTICSIEDIKELFFQTDVSISDPYELNN